MPYAPPTLTLPASGTLLASRFLLQRLAGRGGMGSVYRALDTTNGQPVAVKLIQAAADSDSARRFTREARLLSEVHHPSVVSYVAHGFTEQGQPFLAMEWLEGEDLAQRLVRQPLSLSDTLNLMRRIAQGLAITHSQGIVHRDIKPSNLFLRGGRMEDAVLLDFGLARLVATSQALTGSAAVLGTPGYMAPEQASSQQEIAPSADIFSLGCVLYECLTGQAPFRAPLLTAVLAKILFSEPARLGTVRPELPAELQALMDRMLAKDPAKRIPDAAHLQHALHELGTLSEVPPPSPSRPQAPLHLTQAEQHLVSVLLATAQVSAEETPTLDPEEVKQARRRMIPLLQELRTHGACAEMLVDGSLLATFQLERGTATDQAALAAHCALAVKERWDESFVVLATGLTLRGEPLPVGEVMDRAGEFLRKVAREPTARSQVTLDATTAGLLGPRFQLDKSPTSGTFLLHGEHLSVDESRPLLGRPTPCVGREQELAMLELAFTACVEDTSARALLVTAPPGTGKSRLRHEFLRRLEHRDQHMLVLLGRGDPMNAGSAYGLVGEAVRRLCGILDGEPLEVRRRKLAWRVNQSLPPELRKDTLEFLGELCGVAFSREDSPKLRAAREDPRLMTVQVTRALVTFLQAELSKAPVLLVLEDLHWSDAPSVKLVDELLLELAGRPLLVLALARPEVKELFPELWGPHLQEVPLRGLSQRACTRLIHEVLGRQVPEATVARVVEQSAGNALFLEELIRSEAEGHGQETPGTVLAMLQTRLQRLEPRPRRALLAASIFGRAFWSRGVQALLRDTLSLEELERNLQQLTELEVVQRQPGSRFPGETEYRFRHALVRDAAYSLVPGGLRPIGHRVAGEWLERTGEQDPWVLAEHYQLGQQQERAVHFFTRAGERLFERQDMPGAERCLEAALACEPVGPALAELRVLEVLIAFWREDFERLFRVGEKVQPELALGSAPWARVTGGMILMGAQCGRHADVARLGMLLLSTPPAPEARTSYIETATFLTAMNSWCGLRREALTVLESLDAVGVDILSRDNIARGWTYCARAYVHHFLEPRPWQACLQAEEAVRAFREVNSERNRTAPQAVWGLTLEAAGDMPRAIEVLRDAVETCQRAGQTYATAATQMQLVLVLSSSPEPAHQEETGHLARHLLETTKGNLLHLGVAHLALAKVAGAQGWHSEAESHVRQACELVGVLLHFQLIARTLLSVTLRAQGRVAEARAEVESGVQLLERMGGLGDGAVGAWLALAEACFAQGDTSSGERALRQASRCMSLRAADMPDAATRERFLSRVPENARTLELALKQWGKDWERHAVP
ncbi:serine/threonine-protein kinase PknK [Hyalangium sp.]|uniref:serine/threonine-protein kinase n=1 Tax=Hyalangium sp. TaxID=2028555 RepID=UPI002D260A20|nr:protein kinase [Hyalangium sp.]HYI00343.1 protein kinase [Hyalangium sp.]